MMMVQEKKCSGSLAACLTKTKSPIKCFFHMFNFFQFKTDEAIMDLELTHIWQATHTKVVSESNKN